MKICFFCGEEVGRHSIEIDVNGIKRTFHHGMWKNCLNDFLIWKNEVPSEQLAKVVYAARQVH